jgi:hypothetical protein
MRDFPQHDVRKLIAGPDAYICDECVELCTDFVNDLPDKDLSRLMERGAENARTMSTDSWRVTWNAAGWAWSAISSSCAASSKNLP